MRVSVLSFGKIPQNSIKSLGKGTEFLGVGSDDPTWQRARGWRHSGPQEPRSLIASTAPPGGGASPPGSVASDDAVGGGAHPERSEAFPPSLVTIPHNSPGPSADGPSADEKVSCPNARLTLGTCKEHGVVHMVYAPCRSRECEVCGPQGRYKIAERIAYGVRQFWPCGWLVLTFDTEDAEEAEWKPKAVKKLGKFITWLRKRKGMADLEYAATYELTARGRLHINLVCGPWKFVKQRELTEKWGAYVWVQRVRDDGKVGAEAAKSYNPEALGGYMSKLYQAVPNEWGRRVSYSKGWPKVPKLKRFGEIVWTPERNMSTHERSTGQILAKIQRGEPLLDWEYKRWNGYVWERDRWVKRGPGEVANWEAVGPGEWRRGPRVHGCLCFALVPDDS